MNFLSKLIFLFKKPKIIIVIESRGQTASEVILAILKQHFNVKKIPKLDFKNILENKILILSPEIKRAEDLSFFVEKSQLPILVITEIGEIPQEIRKLTKILPAQGYLILNFDNEAIRGIKFETSAQLLTFGFEDSNLPFSRPPGVDLRASDININLRGANFKINYKGNIVPFWLERIFSKEQIDSVLAAVSVGVVFGLNLVEISQTLKN